MMGVLRGCVVAMFCLACASAGMAQPNRRDPLTQAEAEQIREAGIYPTERVKLYTEFVDEHVSTIKGLTARAHSPAWATKMDNELQDVAALIDELGSNLDMYSDRKADVRKALKPLTEATQRWLDVLHGLPADPAFDLSRKDAEASGKDLADQAAQMLKEQTEYFKVHKDQRGQERAVPQ